MIEGKEPRKGNLLDVIDNLPPETFGERWNKAVEAIAAPYGRIRDSYAAFEHGWIPYTTAPHVVRHGFPPAVAPGRPRQEEETPGCWKSGHAYPQVASAKGVTTRDVRTGYRRGVVSTPSLRFQPRLLRTSLTAVPPDRSPLRRRVPAVPRRRRPQLGAAPAEPPDVTAGGARSHPPEGGGLAPH